MGTGLAVGIGAAAILLAVAAILVRRKRAKASSAGNVAEMRAYRRMTQKCTSCKRKVEKVVFYADENGKAIGLCKSCRGMAERRGLLPL